ncbi:hypothetical protein CK503_13580 [Aliifodinibius salipaludis]|uniref:DUF86 domain-containing protein n=1 Tax=Fodinibius salipaludis TaxID=2032627 RepID=A0A2A2G8L7_9BACT|nr:DUF86 domain-containing protein [Aliifodinibius salipaludis]PAU93185.1 hypothetical protein CK503_13580 [Aliifodinibius salipaludis]
MKHNKVYLSNILDAIDRILDYTEGISQKEFKENNMIQDAVVRNFEIIGEATKNISSDLRDENKHIPWKNMAGMRDKLIHNYMGVDLDAVWNTIHDILPSLRKDISDLLNKN